MEKKRILVSELLSKLAEYPEEMPITFGASKYRKRPLIFNRTKKRGEKLICIEVVELDAGTLRKPEWNFRITVGDLIRHLSNCGPDWEIDFGCSTDAVPLVFEKLQPILSIDLDQPTEPKWRVIEDEETGGQIIAPLEPLEPI